MIKAVEGDDWSAVIDSQTQQTVEGTLLLVTACAIKSWTSNHGTHICAENLGTAGL